MLAWTLRAYPGDGERLRGGIMSTEQLLLIIIAVATSVTALVTFVQAIR
jgi:hypothetical protein